MTVQRRMAREDRRIQLLEVAVAMLAADGADSLTLGRLAERAGVSKPVVYDHFESRSAILLELYRDVDRRQTGTLVAALAEAPATVEDQALAIATCHVRCVMEHGAVLGSIGAALVGSPALVEVRRRSEHDYLELCRRALERAAGRPVLGEDAAIAFLGAADAVSTAAAERTIDEPDAVRLAVRVLTALTDGGSIS